MKTNRNYRLYTIHDAFYLLPSGQGIAAHARGVKLNDTGVFLWETLQQTSSRKELLMRFAAHCGAAPDDMALLEKDLAQFLAMLSSLGILIHDWRMPAPAQAPSGYFKIGPLCMRLICPPEAIDSAFLPFQATDETSADLTIEFCTGNALSTAGGTLLIHNNELLITECADCYQLFFPQTKGRLCAWLSKDGHTARIWHSLPYNDSLRSELFHAVRFLYLYAAQQHGCVALHSASILYKERAWLFSGHSGMGKSTHTKLWQELFHTPVLNGDLNLLAFLDETPVIYGIPWCGTSGIADTHTHPLGGIVLLNQASYDQCIPLPRDEQTLLVSQRIISPNWTPDMLQTQLSFTGRLTEKTAVCLLKCTKNPSAAYTSRDWILKH